MKRKKERRQSRLSFFLPYYKIGVIPNAVRNLIPISRIAIRKLIHPKTKTQRQFHNSAVGNCSNNQQPNLGQVVHHTSVSFVLLFVSSPPTAQSLALRGMCCGETPHNNRHRRNTPAVEIGRGVFVRRRSKMVKCSFATFCK